MGIHKTQIHKQPISPNPEISSNPNHINKNPQNPNKKPNNLNMMQQKTQKNKSKMHKLWSQKNPATNPEKTSDFSPTQLDNTQKNDSWQKIKKTLFCKIQIEL